MRFIIPSRKFLHVSKKTQWLRFVTNLKIHYSAKGRQLNLLQDLSRKSLPTLNRMLPSNSMPYVTLPFKSLKDDHDLISQQTSKNKSQKEATITCHSESLNGTVIWRPDNGINKETEYFHNVLESVSAYHEYLALFTDIKYDIGSPQVTFQRDKLKNLSMKAKLNLLKQISSMSQEDFMSIANSGDLKEILRDTSQLLGQMKNVELMLFSRCLGTMAQRLDLTDLGDIFLEVYVKFLETVNALNMQQLNLQNLFVIADAILLLNKYVKQGNTRIRNRKSDRKFDYLTNSLIYRIVNEECMSPSRLFHHNNQTLILMMLLASDCRGVDRRTIDHFRSVRRLLNNADGLSVEECAIICMGFNKTNSRLTDLSFLFLSISKLEKSMGTVSDFTVSVILKTMSKTLDKRLIEKNVDIYMRIKQLPEKFSDRLGVCSDEVLAHTMTAFHNFLISSEKLEKALLARLMKADIEKMDLKYMSKMAFVVGNLLPRQPDTCDLLESMGQAVIRDSVLFDPYDAIRTLVGLCLYGRYPNNLVDYCLSPRIQEAAATLSLNVDVRRNLMFLDASVRLENPGYHGNILSENFINAVLKDNLMRWSKRFDYMSKRDEFAQDVSDVLGKIVGRKKFILTYILPQFEIPDIALCFSDGTPDSVQQLKIPHVSKGLHGLQDYERRLIDQSPQKQWVVLCLHSMKSFYRVIQEDGTEVFRLCNQYVARERQLRKKGYTVIQVKEYEFVAAKDKVKFITEAIKSEPEMKHIWKELT